MTNSRESRPQGRWRLVLRCKHNERKWAASELRVGCEWTASELRVKRLRSRGCLWKCYYFVLCFSGSSGIPERFLYIAWTSLSMLKLTSSWAHHGVQSRGTINGYNVHTTSRTILVAHELMSSWALELIRSSWGTILGYNQRVLCSYCSKNIASISLVAHELISWLARQLMSQSAHELMSSWADWLMSSWAHELMSSWADLYAMLLVKK